MSEGVRFLLGEEVVEVSSFDPQLTVLEWLRSDARRKGSKEGCAEGDCGACTVVLGELHDGAVSYLAFNACILLLATLDGKQLITVEDLAVDGLLHPVQQAMVDQHGSQCGFCTPGIVMSLFAMYHDQDRLEQPGRLEIDEGLAGNLCRCTGYVPIVKAAREALDQPAADHFIKHRDQIIRALEEIQPVTATHVEFEGRHFFSPRSVSELSRLLTEYPDAVMVAGATDVGLWITKQQRCMDVLIHTSNVMELQKLAVDPVQNRLEIGAAVSYSNAMDILGEYYPDFRPMLNRLGAVQVRNAGTIGGNIANGSPIGDMPPPLIALRARLVLRSAGGRRELDLEDYFIAYGKQDLRPGEFIEKVLLPLPGEGQLFRVYKLSKRFDQDISSVCAAFALLLDDDEVAEIRICYGGMAGIPARARGAQRALLGQKWTHENIERAKAAMADDFQPLSDWRASSEYRMLAAQNLLQRFFLETTTEETVQLTTRTQAQ
jgi:xanthine dehydrogenase small subunit